MMYVYIARQPIFTPDKKVAAYELLYRSSEKNEFDTSVNGDQATRTVVSEALLNFGVETLTGNKKAFVNLTEQLVEDDFPFLLNPEQFVLEILENVPLTAPVLEHMKEFRKRGFVTALDDYYGSYLREEVLECFDIIKIDFSLTTPELRKKIAEKLGHKGKRLLAEKVQTAEEFEEAVYLGCELIQGFYFSKPLLMKTQRKNVAKVTAARLLRRLQDSRMHMEELAEIIKVDAHLTYKLLQRMRTMQYYRGRAVQSIKDALIRMGINEIRRWMALVLMQDMAGKEADEQIRTALVRALFCERLVIIQRKKRLRNDAFMTGMFSVLDTSDSQLPKLLAELDLSEQVCNALLGEDNILNRCLKKILYYERGEWDLLVQLCGEKELAGLPNIYLAAVAYANQVLAEDT